MAQFPQSSLSVSHDLHGVPEHRPHHLFRAPRRINSAPSSSFCTASEHAQSHTPRIEPALHLNSTPRLFSSVVPNTVPSVNPPLRHVSCPDDLSFTMQRWLAEPAAVGAKHLSSLPLPYSASMNPSYKLAASSVSSTREDPEDRPYASDAGTYGGSEDCHPAVDTTRDQDLAAVGAFVDEQHTSRGYSKEPPRHPLLPEMYALALVARGMLCEVEEILPKPKSFVNAVDLDLHLLDGVVAA